MTQNLEELLEAEYVDPPV